MKNNYIISLIFFLVFFVMHWAINLFFISSLFSSFVIALFSAILFNFSVNRKRKPIKGLHLKLQEKEEIISVFFVNLRQTKFRWITGNLYVTNQRFSFVDKRKDENQIDDNLFFHEIKEVTLLPQKMLKNETIKIITFKNEIFYVFAFKDNKTLYNLMVDFKNK